MLSQNEKSYKSVTLRQYFCSKTDFGSKNMVGKFISLPTDKVDFDGDIDVAIKI